MKRSDPGRLSRLVPPGFPLRFELQFFLTGLVGSVLYSGLYLLRLYHAWQNLFAYGVDNGYVLRSDAEMRPFADLLEDSLSWFAVLAVMAAVFAVWHYVYHRQGAKSIYLMRRLPDGWVLHRRCLALPVLELAACAVCALALFWLYFGLYVWVTPDQLYVPGQLAGLWR